VDLADCVTSSVSAKCMNCAFTELCVCSSLRGVSVILVFLHVRVLFCLSRVDIV